jgi:hypothetical protein
MPQIKEYTAENDKLRPSEVGAESFAQAARRVGAFYSQAGEVIKQSAQDRARAAEALARSATARATAAGALATEEKAKAGAESGLVTTAGTAIEQAEAFAGHQEVSQGMKNFAQAQESLTKEWNQTFDKQATADPNNRSIQGNFMQGRFEQWAQSYTKGFVTPQGRDWAEEQVNHLRNHLQEKTGADMSTMAGMAVKSNWDKTITSLTNTARADPSSVEMMVGADGKPGQIDRMADDLVSTNPNLRGSQAAKFKIESVDAAKRGLIQAGALGIADQAADPVAAVRAYAARFPTLISAQDADAIAKAARTQQHVNAMEQREADAQQKRQDEQAVHVGANKNFQDNVNFDPATGVTTVKPEFYQRSLDLVKQNPNAPNAASTAKTYIDWAQSQQRNDQKVTDPATQRSLYDGLFRADKPTTEIDILKAETEHKISSQDSQNLLKLHSALQDKTLKGPIWQDTMKAVHADLTGQLVNLPGAHDAVGEAAYAGFLQSFIPKYLEMERAGTLPANALDINNPKSLLSEAMAPFKRSPAQKMQQMMDQFGDLGGAQTQQPAAVKTETTQSVPPSLRGIASLEHNKDWTRFRDQATGKMYDKNGGEIKQ